VAFVVGTTSTARAQDREQCVAAFDRGQALRLDGKLRAARADFVACARDACPTPLRKDCATALTALDVDLPTVVLGARDTAGHDLTPSAVYVDDEPVSAPEGRAVAFDPGPHVIRFEHPPDAPVVEHVVLRVGEHNREVLASFPARAAITPASPPAWVVPPPKPPVPTHRPTGWIVALAGVGAVGLGSFAYFGLTGLSQKQQLLDRCAPACSDAEVDTVRSRYIAADVSLGVGVVALGIAAFLLLSSPSDASALLTGPQRFARIIWK
jgi:hypothetical protein